MGIPRSAAGGGASDAQRIVYRAAPGEAAVIKGSEVARGWKPFSGNVWKLALPDSFFGAYNPLESTEFWPIEWSPARRSA